ncbi:MerR family transcriptional regulator [Paenibacillus tritici]|uniref:MerR family transcriptional regulator n=1 Tax=Paenibacillus tritici TaxID=1873425 RepID=UPI001BA4D838|nr:MerR family transcriptional regulator [Paenibacillus tritici]QUL57219.1 MerR family transcriptional regulator [Paenibacillus tritici]
MNRTVVTIQQLSEQMGLTSRTLRHWEAEGLFHSGRDSSSGWRTYEEDALQCIRITALLRRMDIPIKEIQPVVERKSVFELIRVIENRIAALQVHQKGLKRVEQQLLQTLEYLNITNKRTSVLEELLNEMENVFMSNVTERSTFKVITLPAMRVAYHIVVDVSPEDKAMGPLMDWLKSATLLGTARLFGGNMKPMPSSTGKPYGYGMCATIPEGVVVPEPFQEMLLPGGLYAKLDSDEDIGGSWNNLMNQLSHSKKYTSDPTRLCLEEHIRNDHPENSGNLYDLNLLEPVKAK